MLNIFKPSKSENHRSKKVADEIRRIVSEIIIKRDLPSFENGGVFLPVPVTVTNVKMSNDLKIAYLYIMPMAGLMQTETMEYFKIAASHIRHLLGKHIRLKSTPELRFFIDPTFESSSKIDSIFNHIKKDASD